MPSGRPAVRPSSDGNLTLAASFQLLNRALSELPSPVGGDQVRARMAALHGREDPLLEPARFAGFLRQAHDAEIADVRKVNDTEYEITRRAAPVLGEFVPMPPAPVATATGPEGGAPPSPPRTAALRFRRGSRALTRPPEVPLVGVVQFQPATPPGEAPAEKPKRRAGPRKRSAPRAKKGA